MVLSELSIRRHVLAFMLSAVLILIGYIAINRIGIDRFPTIEFPMISVTTVLKGGSPDIVDTSVTNVLETAVNSLPGINHIQSFSSPSVSTIAIMFDLEKNIDVGFNEVQAKVNQVLNQLPKGIDPPVVAKVETNATPVMWLSLQGDRTVQQLNLYAANHLKKKLETINGVGQVLIGGKSERTVRVFLSLDKMTAFNISGQDVVSAFAREHIQFPGGFLVAKKTEALLNLDSEFHDLNALQNMIISYRDNAPIRVKDIAVVEDGMEDFRQLARFNGQPTVGLGIIKVPNTNTVAIVDAVKEKLEKEIVPQLPAGMKISVASNDATYIQQQISTLYEHLIEGTILAGLVVWLFLRSLSSTLIISTAIPVSLMGAIGAMYFCGYTFNVMTMLALLLLIGVVVDDAIVVLENIFKQREKYNLSPYDAAVQGSKQVFFAVLAASLSLVAIFAPVIFLGGIIGKFFQSFAVVVTVGVLVSLFVSVTLTPMLCSRFLSMKSTHQAQDSKLDKKYSMILQWALQHPWRILGATLSIFVFSGYLFGVIGKGFVPEEDEGRFLVSFRTPLGANIDYTSEKLAQIEQVLSTYPEIEANFSAIGLGQAGQVNQGMAFITLKTKDQRKRKQQDLIAQARQALNQIPGVQAFVGPVPFIGGQRGEPLQFALVGPNLNLVADLAQKLQKGLEKHPQVGQVDLTLQLDLPQYNLDIDRHRAANAGLSAENIALTVNLLSGGINVAKYNDAPGDGQRYDIRIKATENDIRSQQDFSKIFLKGRGGELVRLDTVASFKETLGPAIISRLDSLYAANFFSSPTIALGDAVNQVNEVAQTILPPGYQVRFLGQAEEFAKTAQYMGFTFMLALIFLYMILASQFNSFLQPILIMAAQPLAIIGGVFALWITNQSLNIYSMIGLVLLIGLVAKNSILLVDLTNQYRAEGQDTKQALLNACPMRLRPILMTSLTVILALLPAALGMGAGSEANAPLAIAIIGGMISSTLLTLVVVPVLYSLTMRDNRTDHFTQTIISRVMKVNDILRRKNSAG